MNALYHVAILEGYLGHIPAVEIPQNVDDAISYLKNSALNAAPLNADDGRPPVKKRRKPRLTPEQKVKQLAQLADMRAKYKAKREAQKAAQQAA
jgi:hypothetical protein